MNKSKVINGILLFIVISSSIIVAGALSIWILRVLFPEQL